VHDTAHLGSEFSDLMDRSCSKPWTGVCRTARKAEQLQNSLLQIEGLQVSTRWTSDERYREIQPLRKFRRISLHGADNPGLVYNVTEYLFGHGINIENLETHTEEAPFGGTTLFMMEGLIAMPVNLSTSKLIHNLDTLQTTLGVDITISNIPIPSHHKFRTASPAQSIV
jgi:glycine cleavage system regulatory protein